MAIQYTLMTSAVLSALASTSFAFAQSAEQSLPTVTVTATPLGGDENAQILAPAKVLSGSELRNKLGSSLGDTLSQELGVSSSGFGAGASRPIIRGMEGPRVKILQNGMAVSDLSSLSNDHAVATDPATARQIEILRGPASLLYGSGAIGGLVNVVNDRIPTALMPKPTGEAEMRFGSVDREKSLSFSADGSAASLGLHVDGSVRDSGDYRIPGTALRNDPASPSGRLPSSFTRAHSLGFGASHIAGWGYVGASIDTRSDRYGIPTAERAYIDLSQTRGDIAGLVREPFAGAASFAFKLAASDYTHTEKEEDGTPATDFANKSFETRWEIAHLPIAGWRGTIGMQTDNSKLSALSAATGRSDTVPTTKSSSIAAFLVEERDFGPLRASAGLRIESVRRRPDDPGFSDRRINLNSYSLGGLWSFLPGYSIGATYSIAQRAPAPEELYSNGPHESTATFDIGDPSLQKERSRNLELSLQKTEGLVRWKANLFENRLRNYVYGRTDGSTVDDSGIDDPAGEFVRRLWAQDRARIRGAEAELSYNQRGEGLSLRGYADTSRGVLVGQGNLPLQPATRVGIDLGYRQDGWRGGVSALHALRQDRLAAFETTETPAYTLLDANLSYTLRQGGVQWTWFALAKNLMNRDVRLSTSLLRDVAPQPGRNIVIGLRTRF
ncbi:TonB-dependent receptor [Noviherbaspirillum saxi]|uniref:TonB-dependent receptor n=1 Tax=Noviherbaspirillum saxi TaxID=2320863 RepID=A0A3A3FN19_9BURK|nr:TonB-dependent receptor [Noviherbaspirillum saxi]RJF97582.1 TonB-dependent receptor [Noviherbaspirillum saxi]